MPAQLFLLDQGVAGVANRVGLGEVTLFQMGVN